MAKIKNIEKWGRETARERYQAGGGATFDERFPRAVWGGGKGPSIDRAFSGDDSSKTEFPLASALREKAKTIKKAE